MGFVRLLCAATFLLTLSIAQNCHPVRYMPLGDSITEIVCWRGYLWQSLQDAGYANVNFVGSSTAQNPLGCDIHGYDRNNEGHSGYLATGIVGFDFLPGWLKKNPADIVTVHLGSNDIGRGFKTSQILDAFTVLVEQMREANPKMKIIVAQIIPLYLGVAERQVLELNARIPLWAASLSTTRSPIWVVDQHTGFNATDLRDGIHPNESGDKKMAARWFPALIKAINSVEFVPETQGMQSPLGI